MEYIAAKKQKTANGIIGISSTVFENIAARTLDDFNDVKSAPKAKRKKPVLTSVEDGGIRVDVNVLCRSSANVTQTCLEVQKAISENITHMTDFTRVKVNVIVKGFFS